MKSGLTPQAPPQAAHWFKLDLTLNVPGASGFEG